MHGLYRNRRITQGFSFMSFTLVLALTFTSLVPTAALATPLKSLPAFKLPNLDGKFQESKEWKGKVVVLDFWATWCTGCRETIPILNRLDEKFKAQGLVIAGVSLDKDPKEKVAKFSRKLKMNYQILLDAEDTLSKIFGFEGLPSVYVFGRDGNLLKAMPGYTASQEKELEALVEGQFPPSP